LTTVTTRLCLDALRRRREVPTQQAPEPDGRWDGPGPEELVLLAGELTSAFAVVLEELTPPQRVAFVLHDVFGVPFDEVARILATTTASAKKLASRARGRIHRGRPDPSNGSTEDARQVVEAFLRAARDGDTDHLVRLLDPDVVRTADPQALPAGAPQRVRGVRAVVAETRALRANTRGARVASVDGRPAIVVAGAGGAVQAALVIHTAGGRIVHYDVVADPRRLALLHIEG
jgi:RNA polymerase sigma-70 factor (ECF subfamily)